ncbi:glycosyltransferase family 2 protein [soil metagenome]
MLELVAPSQFRAVVVMPVFNHGSTVGAMVDAVRKAGLRCLVVDDGSDSACAAVLDGLAQAHGAALTLVRLVRNQGKGGAVMAGLREAGHQGYSHAVQIDADGQHDPAQVSRFLVRARRHPDAVICGCPLYDGSAPIVRRVGRIATKLCVWINTLSFGIRDSMCGLRVYPLERVIPLIDEVQMGTRMDFDTEVLVRLHWNGTAILNHHTPVTYPRDGVSHFRMGLDNWLIARMHVRLFGGMVRRSPGLLLQRLSRLRPATRFQR